MKRKPEIGAAALALAIPFATFAAGCTQATCADYHEPGCWTQPPDAGESDADDSADSNVVGDAGAADGAAAADSGD
ncbi:MAG: hypothetical protein FWD17_06550 [Polyangiaceae bacterium]|nr:hypothetical protein [Polyangiaceae bacterium]